MTFRESARSPLWRYSQRQEQTLASGLPGTTSYPNLCPNNKISGGKLISSQIIKKKPNAAASAFITAANSMYRSRFWVGDYFRRMKAKGGHKYAIVATARKLAIIYYEMVTSGKQYKPLDNLEYKLIIQRKKIAHMEELLKRLKKEVA